MELKDFIAQTLWEVFEGVKAAQEQAAAHEGYEVNPWFMGGADTVIGQAGKKAVYPIEFDVAVEASDTRNADAGIRISGVGGGVQKEEMSKYQNRIKFTIPITLPEQKETERQKSA